MKSGIISLGEALIDFIPMDESNLVYQKCPGGAPANVAVGIARLGVPSTFIGKVGDDVLGNFLKETLTSYGVNTSQMPLTNEAKTGAVFVTLGENGERSFDFYINPSADTFLNTGNIDELVIGKERILHIGSISLIREPSKSATLKAIEVAKRNGVLFSFDPNIRLSLWEDEESAKKEITSLLSQVDILKISDDELQFLTNQRDIDKGIDLLSSYNIPLIAITLGAKGSVLVTKQGKVHVPAMKVEAVDTTGAGDAFVSGLLFSVYHYEGNLSRMTIEQAKQIGQFASVSGGLAASTKGAMTALPTLQEVENKLTE
ncbi:aminoimidazole riboside kinase [Bacillus carboniphilus]|uniref:Aminoimidazole riboside kinase n=1 Tax=Bacillus carboniphilus TaxID=86663 RepID=A0ABY9JUI8_9BACI|nr:aminoimidazole riboside kinase [Bacillus carboniphilus]WLR42398.1 aminoimidazole riboside kinase [Bacillus carboniphilus]